MFHTLAESAADLFIGTERSPAWHRAYRALEHGRAKSACRQGQTMREVPAEIRDFAKAFAVLQIERQKADYALDAPAWSGTGDSPVWAQVHFITKSDIDRRNAAVASGATV